MIPFGQPGYTGIPDNNERKPTLYIGPPRRDGKFAVVYVYHGSGKRLRKLLTAAACQAEADSGAYTVTRTGF